MLKYCIITVGHRSLRISSMLLDLGLQTIPSFSTFARGCSIYLSQTWFSGRIYAKTTCANRSMHSECKSQDMHCV